MRQVVIYPGEDGYWVAECPSLPGCISQGKTKEEATTTSKKQFKDTSLPLRKTDYPCLKSGLRCLWLRYEQATSDFWEGLPQGTPTRGLLPQTAGK